MYGVLTRITDLKSRLIDLKSSYKKFYTVEARRSKNYLKSEIEKEVLKIRLATYAGLEIA